MLQLDQKHGGLNLVEAAIHSPVAIVIFLLAPVISDRLDCRCKLIVVRRYDASISTHRTQGFRGVETEATCMTQISCLPSLADGPVSLCRIFNDLEPVFIRDRLRFLRIAHVPIQMY